MCTTHDLLIHMNMLNYAILLKGMTETLDTNEFPYMKFHTNIRKNQYRVYLLPFSI
jgi:hypothetical protein